MAHAHRIAGITYVKIDGDQIAIGGKCTISIDNTERAGIAGLDGAHGYKETPRIPFIEVEGCTVPTVSMTALRAVENATVTAELANGKTAVLRNAWVAKALEVDTAEGKVEVRFEGLQGDWME